ncbi:MAG: hypothetical protein K2P80_11660 [Beijerinckiaceae bacterium]|nr:hypothetical protein [Beijerinckiaceae bacterium]
MLTFVHVGFGALMGFRLPIKALLPAGVAVGIETIFLIASFGWTMGIVIGLSYFFSLQIAYVGVLLGRTILEATDTRQRGPAAAVSRFGR